VARNATSPAKSAGLGGGGGRALPRMKAPLPSSILLQLVSMQPASKHASPLQP
jgi:hypothetical protein